MVEDWTVTEPCVIVGMPDRAYHADPVAGGSLSHSGAKILLPPGSPAQYRYERDNPPADKAVFALGRGAHRSVLGVGTDIVEVKADDWRTDKAKRARALAEFEGKTALLSRDVRRVEDMAESLAANEQAVDLLTMPGRAEVALFALDERDHVMLRSKLDKLPDPVDGETIIVDYKSAESPDPRAFARSAWNYSYVTQDPWYCDIVRALGLATRVRFLFVVQSTAAPYLSFVAQMPPEAARYGRARNREAIALYARCAETGEWPGPADDQVVELEFLPWQIREMENV